MDIGIFSVFSEGKNIDIEIYFVQGFLVIYVFYNYNIYMIYYYTRMWWGDVLRYVAAYVGWANANFGFFSFNQKWHNLLWVELTLCGPTVDFSTV